MTVRSKPVPPPAGHVYINAQEYARRGSPTPARWECQMGHGGVTMHKKSTGGNCWCGKVLAVLVPC